MTLRAILLAAACVLAAGSPAIAQAAPQGVPNSAASADKAPDPNEVICEREQETGSRVGAKRVCMTRSQWADRKSQDRQEIEKAQTQIGSVTPP